MKESNPSYEPNPHMVPSRRKYRRRIVNEFNRRHSSVGPHQSETNISDNQFVSLNIPTPNQQPNNESNGEFEEESNQEFNEEFNEGKGNMSHYMK